MRTALSLIALFACSRFLRAQSTLPASTSTPEAQYRAQRLLDAATLALAETRGPIADAARREMVSAQAALLQITAAQSTIDAIAGRSSRLYALRNAASAYAQVGRPDLQKKMLDAAEEMLSDHITASLSDADKETTPFLQFVLGQTYLRSQQWDKADQLVAHMKPSPGKAELLCAIASAYAHRQTPNTAEPLFQQAIDTLHAIAPDEELFGLSDIAEAQGRAGLDDAAARTVGRLEPAPRLASLAALALAQAQRGDAAGLASARANLLLIEKLLQDDPSLPIDDPALRNMAAAYQLLGNHQNALALVTRAQERVAALAPGTAFKPSRLLNVALMQNAIGDPQAAAASMAQALQAALEISSPQWRSHGLCYVATTYSRHNDFASARKALDFALAQSLPAPDPEISSAAATLAYQLAQKDGPSANLSFIAALPTPEYRAEAYAAAASGLLSSPPAP